MSNLIDNISILINGTISIYNLKISEKYNLNIFELNQIWNEISGCNIENISEVNANKEIVSEAIVNKVLPNKVVSNKVVPENKPKTISSTISKVSSVQKKVIEEKTCPYNFTRGPNTGNVCGSKIKGEGQYCSRHKQYEGKEQKQKKVLPQPKKSEEEENNNNDETVSNELKKKIYEGYTETQISHMFFRKPELGGLLYHKQTGFLADDNKLIVGKKDGNNVLPLTEEDIKVAKSWNFRVKNEQVENKKIVKIIKNQETKLDSENKIVNENSKSDSENNEKPKKEETKSDSENKVINTKPKQEETKSASENKVSEKLTAIKNMGVTLNNKKINIPVPQLNAKPIEKNKLQESKVSEVVKKVIENKIPNKINEKAKNAKKSVSLLIEQQNQKVDDDIEDVIKKQENDIEDILNDLTKGSDDSESDNNNESGDDLEEEEELDNDYDEE